MGQPQMNRHLASPLARLNRAVYDAAAIGQTRAVWVYLDELGPARLAAVRAFAAAQVPPLKLAGTADEPYCQIPLALAPRLLPALFAAAELPDDTFCIGEPVAVMYPDVLAAVRAAAPRVQIVGREFVYAE